jgi:tetratricopeptide (TPR) repeat protein
VLRTERASSPSSLPAAPEAAAPPSVAQPVSAPTPTPQAAAPAARGYLPPASLPPATHIAPPSVTYIVLPDPALSDQDSERLAPILKVVESHLEVEDVHVREAEELYARYPRAASTRTVLENLLELAAKQAVARGRAIDAERYRVRATELWPETPAVWQRLIQQHEEREAWREVELVARRAVSACPDEAALHRSLASALMRQGRDDEAVDVLRRLLARQDDRLSRLEAQLGSFAGMASQQSSHFGVRFEGEGDAALGKAILQTLEQKYEMLSRTLGFEPPGEVQVILYPRETFQSVSTAPRWAGGYFSHFDGRIRIGTRDLSAGFVPVDLERTLTHELTHAFMAARTRGVAPDDINEGLAQYLSGRRLGYRLAASRAVVKDGRMKVDDFYDAALSFVEYLIDRYRQAAMNDLLEALGTTGDVDRAFRKAYRQSYAETREEWLKQLQ